MRRYLTGLWLTFLAVFLIVPLCGGCGSIAATPIESVPLSNRITLEEFEGAPVAVRLTQRAVVSGIVLPPGSIMRQTAETTCSVFPADIMVVGNLTIPPASDVTLVETSDGYIWNGIVMLGDETHFRGYSLMAGDGLYFTGDLLSAPLLAQIRLGSQREMGGQWYPAGTILLLDLGGEIVGVRAPFAPDVLNAQQQSYWENKARREARCNEICAPHRDDSIAIASCLTYCRSH